MIDAADRLYEQVLVLRCQAADPAAFAELVGRYQVRLRYYLRKLVRDPHAADDVLQEVWLDVFRSLPRLLDAGAFRAWLYRIARARACRQLRQPRLPLRALDAVAACEDDAEESFTPEDVARIHAGLDELPAEQREILVLRFVETMTYDDIATVLGCPVGTVRSRLHYAKRALRAVLERKTFHE